MGHSGFNSVTNEDILAQTKATENGIFRSLYANKLHHENWLMMGEAAF